MILGNLKFDRNILTKIEDIYISILALGDERITAVNTLRKDIFASEVWISILGCQKWYTKKKNNMQKVKCRRIS